MQVECTECGWRGDSSEAAEEEFEENEHGVAVSDGERGCPECGGELVSPED